MKDPEKQNKQKQTNKKDQMDSRLHSINFLTSFHILIWFIVRP